MSKYLDVDMQAKFLNIVNFLIIFFFQNCIQMQILI